MSTEAPDVSDARSEERYLAQVTIEATFGSTDVSIVDLGEHGAQLRHPAPIKLGAIARLTFANPEGGGQVRVQGTIVWSRIATRPDAAGRRDFFSGLRLDDAEGTMKPAIAQMIRTNTLRLDRNSLEKKRRMLVEKEKARQRGA